MLTAATSPTLLLVPAERGRGLVEEMPGDDPPVDGPPDPRIDRQTLVGEKVEILAEPSGASVDANIDPTSIFHSARDRSVVAMGAVAQFQVSNPVALRSKGYGEPRTARLVPRSSSGSRQKASRDNTDQRDAANALQKSHAQDNTYQTREFRIQVFSSGRSCSLEDAILDPVSAGAIRESVSGAWKARPSPPLRRR